MKHVLPSFTIVTLNVFEGMAVSFSHLKHDELVRQPVAGHTQSRHGNRKSEATRPRTSRVQIQHSVSDFGMRTMRVA